MSPLGEDFRRARLRGRWRAPFAFGGPYGPKRALCAPKSYNGAVRRQAAYLRVSTATQDEGMQREAIARAAHARGVAVDDWFSDDAARDKFDRPGLSALRESARRGRLGVVWVWRLDRLGAGALALLTVVKELRTGGAQICSVSESFDSAGPFADCVLAVIGAMAESELEAIRARTAEARARAERAGKHWGRPPAASEVQRILLLEQLEKGLTLRSAAKAAGLSYGSAQRIKASARQVP
jgi:putative DNA-invertase from lambdoid prophage Rac